MKRELLRAERLVHTAGGAPALDEFTFNLYEGEVLFLMGLSGSGIDEIAGALTGASPASAGRFFFQEAPVAIRTPEDGRRLGIYNASSSKPLVPGFTVAENLFTPPVKNGPATSREMRRETARLLAELELAISPDTPCKSLSPGMRHIVEVIKCVRMGKRLIINSDFNMEFTLREMQLHDRVLRHYTGRGVSFIICAHGDYALYRRYTAANRLVVVRDGQNAGTLHGRDFEDATLLRMMTGGTPAPGQPRRPEGTPGRVVAEARDLYSGGSVSGLSFQLRAGEVLGLLDLKDSALRRTAGILGGFSQDYTGQLLLDGRPLRLRGHHHAVKKGVGFIPENPAAETQLPENLSVAENLSLLLLRKNPLNAVLREEKTTRLLFEETRERLAFEGIAPDSPTEELDAAGRLKVLYMRWILARPRVLVCVKPASHLDLLARETACRLLDMAAGAGIGVLCLLTSLPDAMRICDRVAIVSGGQVVRLCSNEELSQLDLTDYY